MRRLSFEVCVVLGLSLAVLVSVCGAQVDASAAPIPSTDCSKLTDQVTKANGSCNAAQGAAIQAAQAGSQLQSAATSLQSQSKALENQATELQNQAAGLDGQTKVLSAQASSLQQEAQQVKQGLQALQAQNQNIAVAKRSVAKPEPLGDFVPCLLDLDQQWAMRGMAKPVDASDAKSSSQQKPMTAETSKASLESLQKKVPANSYFGKILGQLPQDFGTGLRQDQVNDIFSAAIEQAPVEEQVPDHTAVNTIVPKSSPTGTFKRPADVSCSMSIMGYKETRAMFGASVADNYLAIHVTVRNMNAANDFLIHDVQAAVDTGVGEGYFGRFQSGRDKLLVRAVVQRGQVTDPRNVIINSLQVVGAIAAVPTAGMATEMATAVAIFNGQFLPGLSKVVPDPTITYTNNVNDFSFSASASSKTIVPVNGSVPFVTFITQRPIQELPFAWCGYTTQERRWKKSPFFGFPSYGSVLEYCQDPAQVQQRIPGATGIPAYRGYYDPAGRQDVKEGPNGNDAQSTRNTTDGIEWDDLPYKRWKGAALRILEQNTFVVVGGTHIKDAGNLIVNNLGCPTFANQHVDISQTTGGEVVCKVTGLSLSQVKSVNLEQGTNKIAGKIAPASDGDSAQLSFDPSLLADGDGEYGLFLVDATGAETDSQNSVQLSKQPAISSLDSTNLTTASTDITLKGTNLDLLKSVFLTGSDKSQVDATVSATPAKGATSVKYTLPAGKLKVDTYQLGYTIAEVPGTNLPTVSPISVKVTDDTSAAKTVTTTSISSGPTVSSKKVTLKVKVTGASPTGNVQLMLGKGANSLKASGAPVALASDGSATLISGPIAIAAAPAKTNYVVEAQYLGDAKNAVSTSASKTVSLP